VAAARLNRLYAPEPVAVAVGAGQVPLAIGGVAVDSIREQWVVEDRWWEPGPLRRAYFELALADGRVAVVFRDAGNGSAGAGAGAGVRDPDGAGAGGERWYRQRA
jgi:hypothetical protein